MAKRWITHLGIGLLAITSVVFLLLHRQKKIHYLTAPVVRGEILTEVTAAGTVSGLVRTEVSSQLSGQVTAVLVGFNDKVDQGQILAQLDPRTYQARVREATAKLDLERSRGLASKSLISEREIAQAKAEYDSEHALL